MSKPTYTSDNSFAQRLNVPVSQAISSSVGKGHKHYTQKIPSSQTPAFSSYFVIPIREKGKLLDGVTLEYSISALSGLTNASGSQYLLPAFFWQTRIDVYVGNELIDSIQPTTNFLINNIGASTDAKRSLMNVAAGNFASSSALVTKSASSGLWYVPIIGPWTQSSFPLIGAQDLELRIQMDSLSNLWATTFGTATGTPAVTWTSANAICHFSELPASVRDYHVSLSRKAPLHHAFLDVQQQSFNVASGTSSTSLILSAINGYVSFLVFVIRSSSPTNANFITYNTTLSQFSILSSGGENIVGGQPITDLLSRLVQYRGHWNNTFTTDAGAGVYVYSHSLDPLESWTHGVNLGGYTYTGSEQLQLNFSSSLGSAVQVDVFGFTHAAVEVSSSGVRKFLLSA